mmetsp:Transcript_39229/g.96334  ORF Transcript_39229/g.96334 Transcript_39229/m.96334 type:complete len:101 (+) Transcript_39229:1290-1592(+)
MDLHLDLLQEQAAELQFRQYQRSEGQHPAYLLEESSQPTDECPKSALWVQRSRYWRAKSAKCEPVRLSKDSQLLQRMHLPWDDPYNDPSQVMPAGADAVG